MFKIVVAFDNNKTIGYKGWMPWDLPEDLKHYKNTTLNSNIVMGSTTFNGMSKPLPNRITYVVSSKPKQDSENVKWIKDLDAFIQKHEHSDELFYISGGAQIYKLFLPYTDELIVSLVDGEHPSDTKFPDFDDNDYIISKVKDYSGFTVMSYKRK